jgi:hypothetical protein
MYEELYNKLEKVTFDLKKVNGPNNRLGFPEHRGGVFGMVKPRFKSKKDLSKFSKKYPEIYEDIKRLGDKICPFPYTTIQLNKNCICPPHKDKHNVGESCLVSFGKYTGGNIYIDGVKHNAYENPIVFNGHYLEHWNDAHEGTKYSLVYFS